ncbi:MAG TPA: Fur family transcriptional regulator [Gaiellaceae bacterium]|nr:Fur family transcriptional regulator [Gaiellaceae bacterium]
MEGAGQAEARAAALLQERGVKATQQRVRVLAELVREPNDATAQELHERLRARGRRIGLATVYRSLAVLADEGVVDVLAHRPGEACYRLCGGGHHHHLVCSSCHRVVELSDCRLDPWLDAVAAEHGFRSVEHRLELSGRCADCR